MKYYVIRLTVKGSLCCYGPFPSYKRAMKEWLAAYQMVGTDRAHMAVLGR